MFIRKAGAMTHASLVALGVRWLSRQSSTVFYEFAASKKENPDIIGWATGFSTLIECKATRSDFLSDSKKAVRKKPAAGMGQRRYYLCPSGIVKVEDLPKKWGLLWAEKGRVMVKKEARGHPERSLIAELRFLNSMLRRAQIRIGTRPLSEWLRGENRLEAKRGRTPNFVTAPERTRVRE
ncbi:MAG TPA: hypothetical protein VK752_11455 [Bryobacteraceae bacterium]|jgi:hypothetical protein|nr:hypothetical protein [Bryobacteraceae bacterium]